jgi:hypothetical protein
MTINIQKFNKVVADAKTKINDPKWIRAIDRAAEGILSGELIVTVLAHGALVTSANGSYYASDACQCKAFQNGHKGCKHRAAARLMELYETAPEAVSPLADVITTIMSTWTAKFPTIHLADKLMARFRANSLNFLSNDLLAAVLTVIA